MIRQFAKWIAVRCLQGSSYSTESLEIYTYGLECALTDFIQIFLLIAFSVGFHCGDRMLCFCLCFTSIKQNVGGFHAKTHWGCLLSFTAIAVSCSVLASAIPFTAVRIALVACLVMQAAILVLRKPVAHPNHPKSQEAHRKSRKTSLAIAAVQVSTLPLLYLFAPYTALAGAFGGSAAAATLVLSIPQERRSVS